MTGMPGMIATIVPIRISAVITATNTGASWMRRLIPFSKPNVSAIT